MYDSNGFKPLIMKRLCYLYFENHFAFTIYQARIKCPDTGFKINGFVLGLKKLTGQMAGFYKKTASVSADIAGCNLDPIKHVNLKTIVLLGKKNALNMRLALHQKRIQIQNSIGNNGKRRACTCLLVCIRLFAQQFQGCRWLVFEFLQSRIVQLKQNRQFFC